MNKLEVIQQLVDDSQIPYSYAYDGIARGWVMLIGGNCCHRVGNGYFQYTEITKIPDVEYTPVHRNEFIAMTYLNLVNGEVKQSVTELDPSQWVRVGKKVVYSIT